MKTRAMLGAVGLCLAGIVQPVSADDGQPEAPLTALDITPASIDGWGGGLNRGEESWDNCLSLLNALMNWPWDEEYKAITDSAFGENVIDLNAPLAWGDLPGADVTTLLVADREFAEQALDAPVDVADGQVWEQGRLRTYKPSMMFQGDRLSTTWSRDQTQEWSQLILDSPSLADELPEAELRMLNAADLVGVLARGDSMTRYWDRILPPPPADDAESVSAVHHTKDDGKSSEQPDPGPAETDVSLTVLDIAPESALKVAGLNRGEESWNNFISLVGAIVGQSLLAGWDYKGVSDLMFGEGMIRLDAPLAIYELPAGNAWTVYYSDREHVAARLNAPAEIADDEIIEASQNHTLLAYDWNVFHQDRLYIAEHSEGLEGIPDIPPVLGRLPEHEADKLKSADAIFIDRDDEYLKRQWNRVLAAVPEDEPLTEEQQAYAEIRQLVTGVEWMTAGIRVVFDEDDIEHEKPTAAAFHTGILFDHAADSEGAMLLGGLATPDRSSTLAGLPQGDPLLAFAGEFADGDKLTYYRQLAQIGQRYWNRRNRLSESLPTRQFYGVLEEVGEHMQGVRVAAYRNPEPAGVGSFSIVFIADADEPSAFVAELQQMMRLARADELDLANPAGAVTDEEIEALVASLGDRTYRVRRDATNRLLVIGTRATPFLEARLDDESLELRTRAKVILDHFATLQSDEAKHFFGSDLLRQLDPDFGYVIAGETLADGTPIDWITVTVPEASQPYVQQLEAWLGPDWNRWRVVQTDDEIVICVSSRPELLNETLANLSDPAAPSLEVGDWNPEGNVYQFQLHFDAYEFVPERSNQQFFLAAPLEEGELPGLTSFGLTLAADALTCDAHLPVTQLKRLGVWFY